MGNAGKKSEKKFSAPSCITVQWLSETPNRSEKYETLDTRDFVDFTDYDDLSIENIKDAYEKHYGMPQGSCGILLTHRGPSCFLTEQIADNKFYYIRFSADIGLSGSSGQRLKTAKRESAETRPANYNTNGINPGSSGKNLLSRSLAHNLPPVPTTAFPKSVSVADLLTAQELVKPPDVTKVQLVFESYDVIRKGWSEVATKNLAVQNTPFAEGGFRNAFLATQSCKDCI